MDLSVKYMGLKLRNPIIAGSSGNSYTPQKIEKLGENGIGAIVLKSLFEEQLINDRDALIDKDQAFFWYPEAVEHVNQFPKEHGVKEYLELIKSAKNVTDVPIIASINCVSNGEWTNFAKEIEAAGADGIELNIGIFPFDVNISSDDIEQTHVDIVSSVKEHTNLPVAVKIGPNFTNMKRIAHFIDRAGADAIVMFNRFYQPDIHIRRLEVVLDNVLSSPHEITQTLRWISLITNQVSCDLAASTGVHDYSGVVKNILAGAKAVQIASVLYLKGSQYVSTIVENLDEWMNSNGFNSINDFYGKIADKSENISAFERIQFMKKTTGRIV